ncbi:hypothetical protein [Lachnoclostridium phytofermentans]|uniref:hypothetical protein n=1 Tax=Lachnoclostridium phytofermentans TaxID=66219 RepID=UPI0002FD24B3|nr:hypothetical protein [Lachnoclostridium phytofermentans]
MYNPDNNFDCKEERKFKPKEDFCVQVNIFCDEDKKEPRRREDDFKKERKEEEFCVQVNIFCDNCKKEYFANR